MGSGGVRNDGLESIENLAMGMRVKNYIGVLNAVRRSEGQDELCKVADQTHQDRDNDSKLGTLTRGEPKEADEIGKEVCLWRVAHVHT